MPANLPSPVERAFRTSSVYIARCVRYYDENGVVYADVYNDDIHMPAYRCPVMNGGLRRIKAPSGKWDGVVDPSKHPLVLVARQSEEKPSVVLGLIESAYLPGGEEEEEHESTAEFKTEPKLDDEVLSENGGTRTCQKSDGRLCVSAVSDVTFQLAGGGALKVGATAVDDSAALSNPTIDSIQQLLDHVDAMKRVQDELVTKVNLLIATTVWGPAGAPALIIPASPRAPIDLDRIRSKLLRLGGDSDGR